LEESYTHNIVIIVPLGAISIFSEKILAAYTAHANVNKKSRNMWSIRISDGVESKGKDIL
jgi:uncharacterized protein YgiM (DUF1202 family)